MKKRTILAAAVSAAMLFSALTVYAESAEVQSDEETAAEADYIYFGKSEYWTFVGDEDINAYAYVFPYEARSSIVYEIEDSEIAEINAYGTITPKSAGTTMITARTENGLSAEAKLIVMEGDFADSIDIRNFRNLTFEPGEKTVLEAVLYSGSDPDKTEFADESVVWYAQDNQTESGEPVVSLSPDGELEALNYGTCRVTAETATGKTSSAYVYVCPQIQSLSFTQDQIISSQLYGTLLASDYLKIEPAEAAHRSVIFESSDPSVVSDDDSFLWIRNYGTTVITAYAADDPEIKATIDVEIYEPVTPESIRRVSPENVTIYSGCDYPGKTFMVEYGPEKADTETVWSSSDESIMWVGGSSPQAWFRYYKPGNVTLSAASKSNPDLSVTFNATVTDDPVPAGTYTTDITIEKRDPEDGTYETVGTNLDLYELEEGAVYKMQFAERSEFCLPSASSRINAFADSELISRGTAWGLFAQDMGDWFESRPGIEFYTKGSGSETYTFGDRTFTIKVGEEEDDGLIHEVKLLSDVFETPKLGSTFTWPEDLRTPDNTPYMTPAEFNETQHGQGVGDTAGALFLGTVDHREMRVTWDDVVFEAGQSYVYILSAYAAEGYTFADDVTAYLNDLKADKVVNSGSSISLYWQFGPFEAGDSEISRIWFTSSEYAIPYGGQMVLIAHTDPHESSDPITFTSSDPSIVSCEGNLLHANKMGTAVIKAEAANGIYAECTVRVLFSDVADSSKYFFSPVYWAVDNGITVGAGGAGKFSPDAPCTREQFVTFLWRYYGQPEPESESDFSDVETSDWYYKPITWAAEKGITVGLNDGTGRFGVGQACTREQCVTFLHRSADKPAVTTYTDFTDVTSDRYYYEAISWAAEKGITVGLNDGTGRFGVGQKCTRGMLVTFLSRFNDTRAEQPILN